MSNNIVSANRTRPWLGIGVSGEWDNSADALAAAGLDFTVHKMETFWNNPCEPLGDDPNLVSNAYVIEESLPMYANVRGTDNKVLGCVTPQYKIIQNSDAFALIDPFLSNGKITHVGMTDGGLCFMVANVRTDAVIGGEEYEIDIMVTNSFNGSFPCQIIMTPVRIYCQNMYRSLINDKVFLAKHTSTANNRIMGIANGNDIDKKINMFSNIVESSQQKRIDAKKLESLIALLFPFPKPGPREAAYRERAEENRQMFIDKYYNAADNEDHKGTAFGFINAYYDYLSHRGCQKNMGGRWEDRRLTGLVSGVDVNKSAIKAAME